MERTKSPGAPDAIDLFPNGEIGIVWKDGHESVYSPRSLRCECRCAACVDEVTGRKILDDATIGPEIRARMQQGVGNYGVQFVWSDGHSSGIYAHTLLRALCPCAQCDAVRSRPG